MYCIGEERRSPLPKNASGSAGTPNIFPFKTDFSDTCDRVWRAYRGTTGGWPDSSDQEHVMVAGERIRRAGTGTERRLRMRLFWNATSHVFCFPWRAMMVEGSNIMLRSTRSRFGIEMIYFMLYVVCAY